MESTDNTLDAIIAECTEDIRKAQSKPLEAWPFGFKLAVSTEVPKREIWFFDSKGNKHILKNVAPSFESYNNLD